MCAEPWDWTALYCCMPAGPATCVDGEWQCSGPGPSLGRPLHFASECALVRDVCERATPPPSVFFPTCGPADGPALQVYAGSAPLACDSVPDALGEHFDVYLDGLPAGTGETVYSFGAGLGGFASVTRCTGWGGPCVAATSGTIVVRSYVERVRLVVDWSVTFADGAATSGTADALFCPRDTFCG